MFGNYKMHPDSGMMPPYAPAYPLEWECQLRNLEVMTRVNATKLRDLLAHTPFEPVNDRVAFRFMASPGHTLSYHNDRMFDLMVTAAVRCEGLFTQTHLYMFCSDPMGIAAGRELFGYTKKDCTYAFDEKEDGSISGWVNRRAVPVADFAFTPDPVAPVMRLVDGLTVIRTELLEKAHLCPAAQLSNDALPLLAKAIPSQFNHISFRQVDRVGAHPHKAHRPPEDRTTPQWALHFADP